MRRGAPGGRRASSKTTTELLESRTRSSRSTTLQTHYARHAFVHMSRVRKDVRCAAGTVAAWR